MFIYIDESGDLGWSFDRPFMCGGSSRYLTLATLMVPSSMKHIPKRVIKRMSERYGWGSNSEKKAKDMSITKKLDFCSRAVRLLSDHEDILIFAITVKKENVADHIRKDSNKLYNYMIRCSLIEEMAKHPIVTFVPDERSIKVQSGNSLIDYLKIGLWFEKNVSTRLINIPAQSHLNLNLQFIDVVCHCIWRRYEFNDSSFYRILKPHLREKQLFF